MMNCLTQLLLHSVLKTKKVQLGKGNELYPILQIFCSTEPSVEFYSLNIQTYVITHLSSDVDCINFYVVERYGLLVVNQANISPGTVCWNPAHGSIPQEHFCLNFFFHQKNNLKEGGGKLWEMTLTLCRILQHP